MFIMGGRLKEPKICPKCGKKTIWFTGDICQNCYRQFKWKRKKVICPRCKRLLPLKGRGLCGGCYNTVYRLEYQKARNQMKRFNLDMETYKKLTKNCVICEFNKFVVLHHLDQNRKNNSIDNLIGLCPNHHNMLHTLEHKDEIFKLLEEKGFSPKERRLRNDIKGSY